MKTFLFALFVALMLGISCSSFSGKVSENEPEQDTVVRSVRNRSGEYCEFFVVTKQDTSAYSCIFSVIEGSIISEINGCLSMSINLDRRKKFCLYINAITAKNDTTAVAAGVFDETDKYYIPTYKQWLREMELCLKSASKVYDLSKLFDIDTFLPYLSDAAVLASNNLVANFKPKRDGLYSYSDIAKSIEMTPLIGDLNKILDEYGVEVDEVYCEGGWFPIDSDEFIKKYNISKTLKASYDIIGIPVKFHLKKQDEGHANKTAPSEQKR